MDSNQLTMWSMARKKLFSNASPLYLPNRHRSIPISGHLYHQSIATPNSFSFFQKQSLRLSLNGIQIPQLNRITGWCAYSTEIGKCWNCGAAGAFLACGACGAVQPPDLAVDYFKIFGLERCYETGEDNLERKYKDWQKKLHPDLVHSKSEKEKTFAAEQSARVIDAYRTLGKPLTRALYLLKLEGVQVDEEQTVSDPELLAEMMEIREEVEEANSFQELKQIQSQIESKFEDCSKTFQEAFKKRDFDEAISATQRMRYYDTAIEEIVKKL